MNSFGWSLSATRRLVYPFSSDLALSADYFRFATSDFVANSKRTGSNDRDNSDSERPSGYVASMVGAALIANIVSTWMMIGVIWFVQRVHYPLLASVGIDRARDVATEHQRRTGQVVGFPMAVEGVSTLALLAARPSGVSWVWPWIGAALLAVALGSTVLVSVPLHAQMADAPDDTVGPRLVVTNWPRTISWSLRGVVVLVMAAEAGWAA